MLVIVFVTVLVTAGNSANSQGDNEEQRGFFSGFFGEEVTNEEKVQKRVQKYKYEKNLATVSLYTPAGDIAEEGQEEVTLVAATDKDLVQDQIQYQVLSATTLDARELIDSGSDVAVYEVQDGDTVGSIAKEFEVTSNTILWANDIDDPNMIRPGDKIFILPVTGVKHVVKKKDTVEKVAKKYKADKDKIIAFNNLPADGSLKEGEEIIIPDGEKEIVRPATNSMFAARDYVSGSDIPKSGSSIIDKNPKSKGAHRFPYGWCTWYVAQHKYVPWGGNAGTWLYHARAYGAKTGKKPRKGSIMVTSESPWGHVAIVVKVKGDQITVKEMNYKGWGIESSRTISARSRVIKGYIY